MSRLLLHYVLSDAYVDLALVDDDIIAMENALVEVELIATV